MKNFLPVLFLIIVAFSQAVKAENTLEISSSNSDTSGFLTAQDALNMYIKAVETSNKVLLESTLNPRDKNWLKEEGKYSRYINSSLGCTITRKSGLLTIPDGIFKKTQRFHDLETKGIHVIKKCSRFNISEWIHISKINNKWYINY